MLRVTRKDMVLHSALLARCLDFNVTPSYEVMKDIQTLKEGLTDRKHHVTVLFDPEINKVRGYSFDGVYRRLYRPIRRVAKKHR